MKFNILIYLFVFLKTINECSAQSYKHQVGKISYEIKNHVGSICVVVNDIRNFDMLSSKSSASVSYIGNYDVYGMSISGQCILASSYRYGYNGKETDNELKGTGNSLDFGARIYDPRVGRWLSNDPLQKEYPGLSPYNYVGNNPIHYKDPDGKEIWIVINSEKSVKYMAGVLYDEKGNLYKGKDEYVLKVKDDLNKLVQDNENLKS